MRALSIRQPYAELILRGVKTIEYRTRPTRIVGERFWIYASKKAATSSQRATDVSWSSDLAMPGDRLPRWMVELAEQMRMVEPGTLLPTGVLVGSAVIDRVTDGTDGYFRWHLADVERADRLRKPSGHPQPAWFRPF